MHLPVAAPRPLDRCEIQRIAEKTASDRSGLAYRTAQRELEFQSHRAYYRDAERERVACIGRDASQRDRQAGVRLGPCQIEDVPRPAKPRCWNPINRL